MRRVLAALLLALLATACNADSSTDAGADGGLAPFCLGGGFPTCTDRMYVPICGTGECAVCTPDLRVVCGAPAHLIVPDAGTVTRCVADPGTAPAAVCTSVCTLDPTTPGCAP